MVGADSRGISRAPRYLGVYQLPFLLFYLQDSHFLRLSVPEQFNYNKKNIAAYLYLRTRTSLISHTTTRTSLHCMSFWLFPFRSPLLGESLRFLFLALLRCFSSGRSLFYPINSGRSNTVLPYWVSPFRNLRIVAWLTAPRSFWQSSTSFIASWYQGIHQIPLLINHKSQFH